MISPKILFLYFTEPDFESISLVMEKLKQRGASIDFIAGFDYEVETGKREAWAIQNSLYKKIKKHQNVANSIATPQNPFLDRFFNQVNFSFLQNEVKCHVQALREYLQKHPVDLVVLPEDTDYARGRVGALVCSELSLPVWVQQPLYYALFASYPMFPSGKKIQYGVMNHKVKNRLTSQGVAETEVYITGMPGLDLHAHTNQTGPAVYFLQGHENEKKIVAVLVDLCKRKKIDFWIRPHPKLETPNWLSDSVHVVSKELPLRGLLSETGIAIGQTSSALFYALANGLPALFLHWGRGPNPLLLCEGLESLVCLNEKSLEEKLGLWLEKKLDWNAESQFGNNPKPSVDVVCEKLWQLACPNQSNGIESNAGAS